MRVLDLTHTIAENMPVYPGTETPIFAGANTYEKDGFKETKLTMYTHTGTHMDPPAHLFAGRTTLDAFPASQFIGKALVIECSDLNEGKAITLERILQYGKDAENADFLLFHLGWDKRWGTDAYFGDYPCLDDAAMDYIIAGDYKGIGFDVIRETLRTFRGVEHRIEHVCERSGVTYINDSKGTNPDSTIKAVEAMVKPTVLILGGLAG